MKVIAKMPGYLLKIGDKVILDGIKYQLLAHPFPKQTLARNRTWIVQVQALEPVPPGYEKMTYARHENVMWDVEF